MTVQVYTINENTYLSQKNAHSKHSNDKTDGRVVRDLIEVYLIPAHKDKDEDHHIRIDKHHHTSSSIFNTNFFSILAESSRGSMTSTAHPIDSLALRFSNSSSRFPSFNVFESAGHRNRISIHTTRIRQSQRPSYRYSL